MSSDDTYHGGRFDEAATNSAIADLQRGSGSGRPDSRCLWPLLFPCQSNRAYIIFKGGIETIKWAEWGCGRTAPQNSMAVAVSVGVLDDGGSTSSHSEEDEDERGRSRWRFIS